MALLHSSLLYIILLWLYSPYFTLYYSTIVLLHSTSLFFTLYCSTRALLHSLWLYTTVPLFCLFLLDSTLLYHRSTSFYLTLHYSTIILLDSIGSTFLYYGPYLSIWLYVTLPWLYSIYLTLHCSPIVLHLSTWWLYITDSISHVLLASTLLFHGSTSPYITLLPSTIWLFFTCL